MAKQPCLRKNFALQHAISKTSVLASRAKRFSLRILTPCAAFQLIFSDLHCCRKCLRYKSFVTDENRLFDHFVDDATFSMSDDLHWEPSRKLEWQSGRLMLMVKRYIKIKAEARLMHA